jgi:hypothetical protein
MEEFSKNCPKCDAKQTYTNKGNLKKAIAKNIICKECDRAWRKEFYKGENNPFFGKQHTQELKTSFSKANKGIKTVNSGQFKQGQTTLNTKSHYECWTNLYGVDEANRLKGLEAAKHSVNNAGSGNPMFGKPSPTGSGNGWSGWYKGWYFRSLLELSFMIKVIERFGFEWRGMEGKNDHIPYTSPTGATRNYFADFLLNGKYVVEVKPKRLWNTPSVTAKSTAAKKHCLENGWTYRLMDVQKLTSSEIKKVYKNGNIKWLPRYEVKFKALYL